MNRAQIEQLMRRGDTEAIRRLDAGDAWEFLRSLFSENDEPVRMANVDRLMGVGVRLGRAGLEDADRMALEWFDEKPAPRRLDIVAAFLAGYWAYLPRFGPVREELALRFAATADFPDLAAEIRYGFLQAISAAFRPHTTTATKEILRQILVEALQRDFGPVLQPLVTSLVNNAMRKVESTA